MYPYQPYYGTTWQAAQPRTPQGLKWSVLGIGLALGYFIAQFVVAIILALVFWTAPPQNAFDFFSLFGYYVLANVIYFVLGVLVLIFYSIGVGHLYGGRNEYGPAHARNVRIALLLYITALSTALASVIAVAILGGSVLRFTGPFGTELNVGLLYTMVLVYVLMGVVTSALIAAHLALSVRALAKPGHQILVNVAAAVGTATPGVAGALELAQLPGYVARLQQYLDSQQGGFFFVTPPLTPDVGLPAIVNAGLALVVMVLFLIAFRGAWWRIQTQEIKPLLPAVAPGMPWAPVPMPVAPASTAPAVPTPPANPPGPSP